MRGVLVGLGLVVLAGRSEADPVTWAFEWDGGGGYAMRGAMSYDADTVPGRLVTESDLQCFVIEGFRDGTRIGGWGLGALTLDTSWTLNFDSQSGQFVVWAPGRLITQEWNMNGWGDDCGADGFGFNIGNAAQDLCLGNALIVESQVPPERRFPATRAEDYSFPPGSCREVPLLSLLGG
ncbi:hypothetical protein [Anianabacter salinae]|uniref:hypothetical protein n=1 Tax=Anianabacter salinae TaxID=2851023 RepID=UPI00225E6794|nr:hypothetical protein [Anianabacter salinae]MBV0913906.1 hypothetical protein [Anianabacter salinae]